MVSMGTEPSSETVLDSISSSKEKVLCKQVQTSASWFENASNSSRVRGSVRGIDEAGEMGRLRSDDSYDLSYIAGARWLNDGISAPKPAAEKSSCESSGKRYSISLGGFMWPVSLSIG